MTAGAGTRTLGTPVAASLIAAVCIGLVHDYTARVARLDPGAVLRSRVHQQIVDSDGPSPYRFRILVPFVEDSVLSLLGRTNEHLADIYDVTAWVCLVTAFVLLFVVLRERFTDVASLAVVLLMLATMPIALRDHYFQPWSWLELVLCSAALWCLADRDRWWWLLLVTVVATLNRETGMLLPLLAAGAWWVWHRRQREWELLRVAVASAVAGVATYGLIRLWRGDAPDSISREQLDRLNELGHRLAVQNAAILLLGPLLLAVVGLVRHGWARRWGSAWTWWAVPYLASVAIYGVWHEVRLLTPLMVLAAPMVACGLEGPRRQEPRILVRDGS